jgi:nucleotide-binding universal stress UspA family protein
MKILLAVDGSKSSLDAVKCIIEHGDWYQGTPEVELLYVHLPVPKLPNMGKVVSHAQIDRYYREEGEAALAGAEKLLERAGVKHETTLLVGNPAETIVKHAKAARADLIVVGNQGRGAARNLLIGSVATKVLQLAELPVMLVK